MIDEDALLDRAVARRLLAAPEVQTRVRAVVMAQDQMDTIMVSLLLKAHAEGMDERGLVRALSGIRALFEDRFEEIVRSYVDLLTPPDPKASRRAGKGRKRRRSRDKA